MFYTLRRFKEKLKIASGKVAVFEAGPGDPQKRAVYEIVVQICLTAVMVAAALYVLCNNYNDTAQKLASGWLGTVLGYWFR